MTDVYISSPRTPVPFFPRGGQRIVVLRVPRDSARLSQGTLLTQTLILIACCALGGRPGAHGSPYTTYQHWVLS